jgi:SAM-dependent methyltransferase
VTARDLARGDDGPDSTFADGRPAWLGRLDKVRNVVRQEMISRQLNRHLPTPPARILDVGAGQGTRSIRLARAGHQILAVEPDWEMRADFPAALDAERAALWRPAARQDWHAALTAFDEHDLARAEGRDMRYMNEIGAPARADSLGALTSTAAAFEFELENWYGVRIAVDAAELDPPPPSDPGELAALPRRRRAPGRHRPVPAVGPARAPDPAQAAQRHAETIYPATQPVAPIGVARCWPAGPRTAEVPA